MDPNSTKDQKALEKAEKEFYDAVLVLREDARFQTYLSTVENLRDHLKEQLLDTGKSLEDIRKVQMYCLFADDLLNFANAVDPNPTPTTD